MTSAQIPAFGGLDQISPGTKKVCITYGVNNYEALKSAGFKSILWIRFGTPVSDLDSVIAASASVLDQCESIYVDLGESRYAKEVMRRLGERAIEIKWPNPYASSSALLEALTEAGNASLGIDLIRKTIENAKPAPIEGIFSVRDVADDVLDLYENGEKEGMSLDMNCFRTASGKDMLKLHRGTTMSVAGIPGSGKSRFTKFMMVRLAEDYDCKFALFDKETKPRKTVAQLCAIKLRKPFMRDLLEGRMDKEELHWAMNWVDEHFKFIRPSKGEYTVDDLLSKADVLVKQFGIDGLIVDAYNNLSQRRPKGAEPYEYLATSLEKFNDFRESRNVLLGIVVHPPKLEKNKKGSYDPPTPYEAMGGSHFFNKCDMMLAVHRNKLDQTFPVDVHIQKLRDEDMGILGVGHPMYDPAIGLYFDGRNELGFPIYGESVIEAKQRYEAGVVKIK